MINGANFDQQATRWNTGPTTNLNDPDINMLPILNGKVPEQHCFKKFAPFIISLRLAKFPKHFPLGESLP